MQLPSLKMRLPSLGLKLGRGGPSDLVGLDIQPGYAVAAQARVNGSLLVQRAAGIPLPGDAMREGEVLDEGTLAEALRELFGKARLDRRVRIGVANQRTVLRMLELPPLTDRKELDAAVRFQAEDQMPMPLESAVLDYHPLGVVETPAGPRQRVAVVAAQRDMIERLLSAARRAGLRPEAIDLSAFALIRALHRPEEAAAADGAQPAGGDAQASRVLYLNVGGLTNMAIAEGVVCRFTRVVGGGLESMAGAVAERHHMPLVDARELLAAVDLTAPVAPTQTEPAPSAEPEDGAEPATEELGAVEAEPSERPATEELAAPAPAPEARSVMESGIRDIAAMVRNSLDFHRAQEGGGEVSSVVISGPALAIPGFTRALSGELGIEVREQTVGLLADLDGEVSPQHLAVAAGLAVQEGAAR
jgi:type IV pilus assembly protein PilM